MTIDQQARATLAELTRWILGAHITSFQFDDAVPKSAAPAIRGVYNQFLWLLYSDLREHRLIGTDKLSQAKRDVTIRCVLFLKSGLPYVWPVLSCGQSVLLSIGNLLTFGWAGHIYLHRLNFAGDMSYWPFFSQLQYATALDAPVYLSGRE